MFKCWLRKEGYRIQVRQKENKQEGKEMASRSNPYTFVILHLVYVIVLYTADAQNVTTESTSTFDFDCRRTGVDCGTGNKCNLNSGRCTCSDNSTDYMCGRTQSDCTEEDKYGEGCSFKRVQVVCSSNGMLLNINPHGSFQGVISVYSESSVWACQFKNISNLTIDTEEYGPDKTKWSGYGRVINNNDDECGNATVTEDGQSKNFTRRFIVQYSPLFVTAVDQIITARCTLKKDSLTVFGSIPSVESKGQYTLKNITVDDEAELVTFKIVTAEDRKDIDSKSQVVLGDKIELIFQGFQKQKFRLVNCLANNTVNKTARLITDGCPDETAKSLFYDNILIDASDKFEVILRLKAFRFTDNTQVAFVCNITLCNGNDTSCSKDPCTNYIAAVPLTTTTTTTSSTTPAPVGKDTNDVNITTTTSTTTTASPASASARRRRSVESSKTVGGSITVVDSRDQLNAYTTSSKNAKSSSDCEQDSSLLVLVILLAIFVVILLCIIGVVVTRTLRIKSKVSTHKDTRHAEPVQTMRLPRLEINATSLNQPC